MKGIKEEEHAEVLTEIHVKAEVLTPRKTKRELMDEEKPPIAVEGKRPVKRRRQEYAGLSINR